MAFFFQLVFMDTAATIPTGAMAERWKLAAFVVYGFFMAATVGAIRVAAQTGNIGDGKVFVLDLEQCLRIRTGDTGSTAIG